MPPLGLLMGKVDFTNLFVTLSGQTYPTLAAAKAGGAVTLNVGLFLNAIVDFTLVAFAIFLMIKQVNRWKPQAPAPAAKKDCPFCFSGIHLNATRCPQCTSEIPKPVSADIEKEKS
jgi:large conductance mechanosensitive channel